MKGDNRMLKVIRQQFRRSGLSIKQLAERAGLQYATAHGLITRDYYDATVTTIEKVCRVLELELVPKRPTKRD